MMRSLLRAAAFLALALSAPSWAEVVYKSIMPDGRIIYSEKPVPGAKKVEQMGTHGFLRQWGYEWGKLIEGAPVEKSTAVLDYWFGSSSYKGPNRAADPPMSELFRSSYLRALAWATDRGLMPPDAAQTIGI